MRAYAQELCYTVPFSWTVKKKNENDDSVVGGKFPFHKEWRKNESDDSVVGGKFPIHPWGKLSTSWEISDDKLGNSLGAPTGISR